MSSRPAFWMACALCAITLSAGMVRAQTPLLQEVRTVSNAIAPVEREFAITQAGSYRVQLVDLRAPAAFTSLKLAVTNGATILGQVTGNATTPATATFDAPQATVVIRIVGRPVSTAGTGSVGVTITRVSDSAVVQDFVETIGAPVAELPDHRAVIDETITATSSGNFQIELADLGLPQALNDLILSVTHPGDTAPLVTIGGGAGTVKTATFAATAGEDYHIVALAESDATLKAGLFSVRLLDGGGSAVFSKTQALGRVEQLGTVTLSAGPHELVLTDLQFPAPLSQVAAALSSGGLRAALASTSGSTAFSPGGGTYEIHAVATATGSGPGSYGLEVRPSGGTPLFSTVKTLGGAAGGTPGYSYIADVPNAGAYKLRLADLEFPAAFTATQLAVSQAGNVLGTLSAPGTLDLNNVAAGKVFIVVLAQARAGSSGVLGIDLAPAAGRNGVFEITQGVGNVFESRKVSVLSAGSYRVTVQDVGFPIAFSEFGAVASRGAQRLGTVHSGSAASGAHFDFEATPGNYFVTFVSTPNAAENVGTYGLLVSDKPPDPAVTLTANPAQVNVGATTDLTWTVSNATSCLASDGWTGDRSASGGTFKTAAINATTTFTLACTGDGGSTTKSVTVTTQQQSSSRSGGGGAWDPLSLLCLGLLLVALTGRRLNRCSRGCESAHQLLAHP